MTKWGGARRWFTLRNTLRGTATRVWARGTIRDGWYLTPRQVADARRRLVGRGPRSFGLAGEWGGLCWIEEATSTRGPDGQDEWIHKIVDSVAPYPRNAEPWWHVIGDTALNSNLWEEEDTDDEAE